MPDPQTAHIEQEIATRLHAVYDFVCEAVKSSEADYARYGALNSIVVLLRQPVEVADRLSRNGDPQP